MPTCETYRPVAEDPRYLVSNHGNVIGPQGKKLKPGRKSSGHLTVNIGKGNSRAIHALVLTAFKGPCPEGMEGLHDDGDPSHNDLGNLRWGTRSDNHKDRKRHGQTNDYHKLRMSDAKEIRTLVAAGHSLRRVAATFGVAPSLVWAIKERKIYV